MTYTFLEIDRRRKESVNIQLFNAITHAIQKQTIPPHTPLSVKAIHELVPELSHEAITSILDEVVASGIARRSNGNYFTLMRKFPAVAYQKLNALHELLNAQFNDVKEEISETGFTKHYPKRFKDAEFKDREPLFMIQRKYYGDGELIAFSNTFLPLRLFKDIDKIDFNNDILYNTLAQHYPDYSFEYSRRISSAVPASIYVSDVMKISRNTPMYYARIHSFTQRYKQFEYADFYVLADRFIFTQEFSATDLKKLL